MANLANGHEDHRDLITSHPQILRSLRYCMSDSKVEVRRPAVSCILQLIRANPLRRQEFQDTGIISTLRHMCDWSGGASLSPGGRIGGHHHVVEDDEVISIARQAVVWLDHGGDAGF
jgi:armadillo repeat-containing protein 8